MERFHNRFYNRKTDSIAAIFACMCFIDFIEFIPDMCNICFWYRSSCIKYGYPHFTVFLNHFYLYHHIPVDMMTCIADIIFHDLLYFKFICPCIDIFFCMQENFCPCLICHDFHTLEHAPYKCCKIKSVKHNILIAEFQLV